MFRGALYAARPQCRNNPDWIAQAANSLREILYPFYSPEVGTVGTNKKTILNEYGSVTVSNQHISEIGRVYNILNALAHHGNARKSKIDPSSFTLQQFEQLLLDFQQVMSITLTRQLDVHSEIDAILKLAPQTKP